MKSAFIAAILLAAAMLSASADELKKIDFTQPLSEDGETLTDDLACRGKTAPCTPPVLTLGEVVYRALRAPEPSGPGALGMSFEDGLKRDDLAHAIRTAKDWPLQASDRDLIKKQIARVYSSPVLIGVVSRALSPDK